jgi:TonB family protein
MSKAFASPVLAPQLSVALARLPAPKSVPNLPAAPQILVTPTVPLSVERVVLPSPAPILLPRPSPVFASTLPAVKLSAAALTPRTGTFFSTPATVASPATKLQVATGAFGATPASSPRPVNLTTTLPSGFGSAGVTESTSRSRTPAVASNAFGKVAAAEPSQAPGAKPATAGKAFATAVTADPLPQPALRQAVAEALEILDKPRPAYTEQARRARVEGDVVLEVLFTGSGSLRVLRVVERLGYGLEQNAIDAVAKIRFRPAREDGHTIDTIAMVRISFQLAY